MNEIGAFGARMANHFHLKTAPSLTTHTQHGSLLAVTRLCSEMPLHRRTTPIDNEGAFLVEWQLAPLSAHKLWANGCRASSMYGMQYGVSVVDLEAEHAAVLDAPFDCLHFYLPRAAMNEIAMEHASRKVDTLRWPSGKSDDTVNCLGRMLLEALEPNSSSCRIFLDHLLLALTAHFARVYGGVTATDQTRRGGLAPWQLRRATELLFANIDGNIQLASLAAECQLSESHFARAFKSSIGKAPHRWLIEKRVERAKQMLLSKNCSLVDIALQCGFSEQATFCRTFKREVGTSPGVWRRMRQA